ncbi:hypothetical protein Tco_1144597 [Tanacetum coccineum]
MVLQDTWRLNLLGAIQENSNRTTLEGVNQRVIELATTVDQEDEIIYSQLDDARYDRALLRARVNRLDSDRPFHRRTALLIEEEARLSRAAWARSMDACDQRQLVETLKIVKSLKAQMILELQRTAGTCKDPAEPGATEWRPVAVLRLVDDVKNGTKRKAHKANEVKTRVQTPPPVADPTTTTSVNGAPQLQASMIDEGCTACWQIVLRPEMATMNLAHTREQEGAQKECGRLDQWTDVTNDVAGKEIKKIEAEMWNLKVQGTDVVAYNQPFQELALLCDRMFPEETDKIERYVGGMPDLIYSSVVASKPKTMRKL